MLLAVATGGLWRVLWGSIALAVAVAVVATVARRAGASWRQIRIGLLATYGIGYVWWFFDRGVIIDRISVLWSFAIFLGLASGGFTWREWLRTGRDLAGFVAMWIAYDESRGVADGLGMPIQTTSVRDLDRMLFFGSDAVVSLQQRFLEPVGTVRWYDVVGSCVYYSHFIVPPATMAALWLARRSEWVRYLRRFATVMFGACVMFVLLPTAPPWMAANGSERSGVDGGLLAPLRRPTGNGWRHIGLDGFDEAWDTGRDWANEVAAMPSLHSAYALFVVVFFWPRVRSWWWRAAMLTYPATMAVALMYFGEHYFVDALGGWALVGASFWAWNRIEARRTVNDSNGSRNDHVDATREVYDASTDRFVELIGAELSPATETAADIAVIDEFADAVDGPILDAGCGPGRVAAHLARRGVDVSGVDLAPAMVTAARDAHPGIAFEVARLDAIPADDDTYGGIVSWYSVIATPPDELADIWAEFGRVLRPGGDLLVAFQAGSGEVVPRPKAYGTEHDFTLFHHDVDQVAATLRDSGFEVIATTVRPAELEHEDTPQAFVVAQRPDSDVSRSQRRSREARPSPTP